jgi:hypothetical protein
MWGRAASVVVCARLLLRAQGARVSTASFKAHAVYCVMLALVRVVWFCRLWHAGHVLLRWLLCGWPAL